MKPSEARRRQSNKQRVLALLLSKAVVLTGELVAIHHRFSASIFELRKEGHVIEVRPTEKDGVYEYRYVKHQLKLF